MSNTFNAEGTSYTENLTSLSEDCQDNSRACTGAERLFRRTVASGQLQRGREVPRMRAMPMLQAGQRVHLVDGKGRQYALTLKAGDRFQHSGRTIPHDAIIGRPDGARVRFSGSGKTMVAVRPTLAEYTLKMPRGAQVLYPKDVAMILTWADVYPGACVFEAGVGSAALTLGLLRAVGDRGTVVSYETREDFARTAVKNIERYCGAPANFHLFHRDAYEGIAWDADDAPRLFDRVVLDLPEPWNVVPHVPAVLRSGGVYLSFVPTVPQVVQTVDALRRANVFGLIETFESLVRHWNVEGRSVRPDLRMIAHSGFITVARRVERGDGVESRDAVAAEESDDPDADGR